MVISHGRIGADMVRVVRSIVSDPDPLMAVGLSQRDSIEKNRVKLSQAIKKADRGKGVLLITDLLGATPCNLCRPFLKKGEVAMVTGYNLPMLLKLAKLHKPYKKPEELATFIKRYGQRNISVAEKASQR